jgi:hypothetical protein
MAAPREKLLCVLEYHTSKSVVTVQRPFRAKYAKDLPTGNTICAWYKQFTETGCLCKQKSSGRPLTAEDDVEWNIDATMLMHVWQELEYCIDVCCVTHGAHIEHL